MPGGWGHIWSPACGLWYLALSPLPIFGLVWIFFHLQDCGKEISWLFRMTPKIRNKQIPPEHQEAHQWFGQTLGGEKSFQMIKWERHRKPLVRTTERAGCLDNGPRAEAFIQSMCLLLQQCPSSKCSFDIFAPHSTERSHLAILSGKTKWKWTLPFTTQPSTSPWGGLCSHPHVCVFPRLWWLSSFLESRDSSICLIWGCRWYWWRQRQA